jgi:hypothetical protein
MSQPSLRLPTEQDAITISQAVLQRPVHSAWRFPTGLCHYVYAVTTEDQQEVVVRIARPGTEALLTGGVFWSRLLRPLGVPLPTLLYADLEATIVPFPFMLLERLPGVDLYYVYRRLSWAEKGAILAELAQIQAHIARSLPSGNGFGEITLLHQPLPHRSLKEAIEQFLLDGQQQLAQGGVMDPSHGDESGSASAATDLIWTRSRLRHFWMTSPPRMSWSTTAAFRGLWTLMGSVMVILYF